MARQRLESLRSAGIEWLPTAPLPEPSVILSPPSAGGEGHDKEAELAPVAESAAPPSLFGTPEVEPSAPKLSVEERRHALEVLSERVSKCTRCAALVANRRQTVFGIGKIDPELCFIGEAPGSEEDLQGEPFVGPAGQLLNRIIAACGMRREEVYICNILRCRPPGNRLPLPDEAANCREYLDGTLALVRPRFICCLGACAAQNLLGINLPIGKMRGKFYEYHGIPVICTYHPAYLLRSPDKKRDVWDDMKKLLARMGRPVR
jgi:DNA polymerase